MALTITETAVSAWALTPQNSVREGATMDLSGSYHSTVHVDVALGTTAAHIGTRIILETSSSAADDEFWTPRQDFVALVGTNNTEPVTNNPLALGATLITVADTTGYTVGLADLETLLVFLLDNTVANSELIRVVSYVNNTSVTIKDGVKREHANTSVLSNIAASFAIDIPFALRARVLIDNMCDTDGATVYSRMRLVRTTAI